VDPKDYGPQVTSVQQLHDYAEEEVLYNRFLEPAMREAISLLPFPKTNGRAGCGPGGLFRCYWKR
jgi:hypothetical protein